MTRSHPGRKLTSMLGHVRIYYDGECVFCRRWVRIILRVFLLQKSSAIPGQSDPAIWQKIQEHNSWIIVDAAGRDHYGFDAMMALLAASPIFFFLAPIGRIPFVSRLGERYYRYVVKHRSWF